MRRESLVTEQVYHVFSRSIAGFRIFNNDSEYARMLQLIRYYKKFKPDIKFSRFNEMISQLKGDFHKTHQAKDDLVDIIAYCVMPTHIHMVLRQRRKNGVSVFMNHLLNSYTRYFNTKHERKGPLWESRFKSIAVATDEYLIHLTRYVHLNPVSSELVEDPELWPASSYGEYLGTKNEDERICVFHDVIGVGPADYRAFVEDRAAYQRELQQIKALTLE